ncbi:MAG: CoA transferase [Hyphomicrobiales bacterium]|nr:MAG: CoA transferase [Hyphomicrobiales bacterium]
MSLAGIRVIDFCWVGAGAFVTRILSDMGAEVIKVESRAHPDNLRLSGPHTPGAAHLEGSGYFATRNTGKKSIALNMQDPEAREIAAQLIDSAALVTNNFRPGIMERWGLDYASIRHRNPGVVFMSMPMQGKSGPHRDFVGFGSTIAAMTGIVEMAGMPGRPPVGTGTHYPDHIPNPGHALVAVLAALLHRQRTGEGQEIELAQIESTINLLGAGVIESATASNRSGPQGNARQGSVPRGVYPGAGEENWIAIEVTNSAQWEALVGVLGLPGAFADPELEELAGREAKSIAIDAAIGAATKSQDVEQLAERLRAAGVPAARVSHANDVFNDPFLATRRYWQELPHQEMKTLLTNAPPFKRVGIERTLGRTAPLLGEHTIDVVRDLLGMPEAEARRLMDERVFY